MRQRFDPGLELDERAELGKTRDAALTHLPCLVRLRHARPRVGLELFQPERNFLRGVVHSQDFDRDFVTGFQNVARARDAGPCHLRNVEKPLDPRAEIDKRPVLTHGSDAPGEHRARDDRAA